MNCNMGKYRFFPIFFLLLLVENLVAQPAAGPNADTSQIPYIDISKITLSQEIAEKIEFTYIDPTETLSEKYGQLAFSRMTLKNGLFLKTTSLKKRSCDSSSLTRQTQRIPAGFFHGSIFGMHNYTNWTQTNYKKSLPFSPKNQKRSVIVLSLSRLTTLLR